MTDLKTYPPYKNAVDEIVNTTSTEGYGKLFTHEQLKEWMDITDSENPFAYMSAMEKLKDELLLDHNIFLDNERGNGYRVLEPDEQVTVGADKFIKKAQKYVGKSKKTLLCVNDGHLSMDNKALRLRKMERIAFLQASFRKKQFSIPQGSKIAELPLPT